MDGEERGYESLKHCPISNPPTWTLLLGFLRVFRSILIAKIDFSSKCVTLFVSNDSAGEFPVTLKLPCPPS